MNDLLADPFFQSSVAPLALGFVLTGAARAAASPRAAAAGATLAFIAVFAWVVGAPSLPPPSSLGKLYWTAVAGLGVGLAMDSLRVQGALRGAALLVWSLGALYWIAAGSMSSPREGVAVALAAAALGLAAFYPAAQGDGEPVSAAAPAFAWALAVGGVALIGSSASIAQLGLALTAAIGGFLLWNWPKPRYAWGALGRVAQGVAALLGLVLAVFSAAPAAALLPALLAPFAPRFASRLPLPNNALGRALRPAAALTLAVIPALISLGLAFSLSGGESSPY